ncbi:MAG: hypothetical protein ABI356_12115 [Steroidobacteraceae bacterium]
MRRRWIRDDWEGPPPTRGTLLQTPPELLSTLSISALLTELELPVNQLLLSVSSAPLCDIIFYHIQYATVGGAGEATTASAVLMIPNGLGGTCSGERPIVQAPSASVSVLDLEAAAIPNDPYANLKQDFAIAKALVAATSVSQGAADGGALAVAEAYHAMLVAPICFAATRSFFAGQ